MTQPIDATVWKRLMAMPANGTAKKAGTKAVIADKKAASLAMWEAIDKDDIELLRQALDAGASQTNRRTGRTALWEAIYRQQWENAELLREHGFDVSATTQTHHTLYGAILERDNVEEAERLLAWGVDPTKSPAKHFLEDTSGPRLLQWWLEHGNMGQIAKANNSNGDHLRPWISMGARGTPQLRAYLNEAWHIDASDTQSMVRKLPQAASFLWETLARTDDVERARGCMMSGWGMPLFHQAGNTAISFGWRLVFHKAWNLVDWIIQVPELRQQMIEHASVNPRIVWWSSAADGVPSIERIAKLGHDFTKSDTAGNTVAHEAMKAYKVSRSMVQWFIDHYPQLLQQANHEGATPLDGVRDPKMKAQAQAMLMKTQGAQHAAPAVGSSRRL
jgi:hypothetical protein